jgi:hypothetical protein
MQWEIILTRLRIKLRDAGMKENQPELAAGQSSD